MSPKVSVVIVAYKNMDCLSECLNAIGFDPEIEVVVVNNSHQNRGFGAGCNLGAALSSGEVLVFLNPDSVAKQDELMGLAELVVSDETIGLVGPALMNDADEVVLSVSRQPTRKNFWLVNSSIYRLFRKWNWVNDYWFGEQPPKSRVEVGVVSGAVMAMNRRDFETIGGFDETFFLYWEEVDLARRFIKLGKKVVYEPSIKMKHSGGMSSRDDQETVLGWFKASRFYFMKKYFGVLYALVVEAWFAALENWVLVILMLVHGYLFNLNGLVITTIFYNELVGKRGRYVAALLGGLIGLIGLRLPQYVSLIILVGWIIFDLGGWFKAYRKWFSVLILLGLLWSQL